MCGINEGDCDNDDDCMAELKCGTDNCPIKIGLQWDSTDDCCYKPCTGGDNCCTSSKPCGVNEGDCDNDDDCMAGLKCGFNNCPIKLGLAWDSTDDCCYRG